MYTCTYYASTSTSTSTHRMMMMKTMMMENECFWLKQISELTTFEFFGNARGWGEAGGLSSVTEWESCKMWKRMRVKSGCFTIISVRQTVPDYTLAYNWIYYYFGFKERECSLANSLTHSHEHAHVIQRLKQYSFLCPIISISFRMNKYLELLCEIKFGCLFHIYRMNF